MAEPATKEIKIIQDKNGLFYAKFANGGQLPAVLGGMWTHESDLKARISHYLSIRVAQTTAQKAEAAKTQTTKKPRTIRKKVSA